MKKKRCSKCKKLKSLDCFNKLHTTKSGLNSWCKNCFRKWRLENKENILKWRQEHSEELKLLHKNYYSNNKEKLNLNHKRYKKEHEEEIRVWQSNYKAERRKNEPIFRLINNLRSRTNHIFKNILKINKNKETLELVGCTPEFLKEYIEAKFTDGMTWENYGGGPNDGGWWVDHVIPLASGKTEEDMIKLNHYTNLQPMWALENMKKSRNLGI